MNGGIPAPSTIPPLARLPCSHRRPPFPSNISSPVTTPSSSGSAARSLPLRPLGPSSLESAVMGAVVGSRALAFTPRCAASMPDTSISCVAAAPMNPDTSSIARSSSLPLQTPHPTRSVTHPTPTPNRSARPNGQVLSSGTCHHGLLVLPLPLGRIFQNPAPQRLNWRAAECVGPCPCAVARRPCVRCGW
eukprot:1084004-Rhodomonas_salina.1